MSLDLPSRIWYLGGARTDSKISVSVRRPDAGETFILVWSSRSDAEAFIRVNQIDPAELHDASTGVLLFHAASDFLDWVLVDARGEDNDSLLKGNFTQKLSLKSVPDIWRYIFEYLFSKTNLLDNHLISKEDVSFLACQIGLSNPSANPVALSKEWSRLLPQLSESFTKFLPESSSNESNIKEVFRAVMLCGAPTECARCGSSSWHFKSLSTNFDAAAWLCCNCGCLRLKRGLFHLEESGDALTRRIPKHVQREVWQRDKARCADCGSQERLEFDHIIPVSKGGANTTRNLQLLCEACNRRKSDKEPGLA